jgi:hypothetical protein
MFQLQFHHTTFRTILLLLDAANRKNDKREKDNEAFVQFEMNSSRFGIVNGERK